jgi:hypothetical protein
MKKTITTLLAVSGALLVLSQTALAIPAFARKHAFNCNMCHVAFPKLNDFGQRFRDNGYQIPGQQGKEKTIFQSSVPLAIRTNAGYSLYHIDDRSAAGFHIYGVDLLSGGVLNKNISYLFIYTPRIDEPAADFTGPGTGNNPWQLAAVESAAVVFSNIVPDKLNLRVGRFEPDFHLLSSKRSYYILQPYEIYDFAGTQSSFDFSANQIGLEATGRFRPGLRYAVGYINGTGGNPDNNKFNDLYATMSKVFCKGEGQSAGQRLGVFGYLGWQPTAPGTMISPLGDTDGGANRTYYRVGSDISLNWKTFNLEGLAFYGSDNGAFNPVDQTRRYDFWGGVTELDWAGCFDNRLVASVMYNWVRPPSYDSAGSAFRVDAYSALARYYVGSWSAVNVAIHAEYTHRVFGSILKIKDDLATLMIDFAF